jgi:hypothetical protein
MEHCHTSFFKKLFFILNFFKKTLVPFLCSTIHDPLATKNEQNTGVSQCGTNRFNPHFLTVERYHKISYLIIQRDPKNLSLRLLKPFLFFPHFLNHVIQYHILPYKSSTERFNIQNESWVKIKNLTPLRLLKPVGVSRPDKHFQF